ncbi:T9SS type A sorting domain-containing protein [Reichenbachiella ulvae]|uniref:T9SS type A sorting domain-containing protein n=1 Tax=Reichenbachiella ulvae TaxID=2980104 RepID=A0ABT3D0K6_9BACT|nr:T9SS type A sorting domain-containing protein [Reichenbachiella ulvae]MCV9389299.1 T9SS type A sorting domain-containing protein [Reichenbachiella ulvae]
MMRKAIGLVFILWISTHLAFGQVHNYEWPSSIPKSDFYEIKVIQGGKVYDIHPHLSTPNDEDELITPTDRSPDNGIANYLLDRSMTFGTFAFEGEVWIEVTKKFGSPARRVEIAPKAFGINPTYFDGYRVRFKISHDMSEIAKYISVDFVSPDNRDEAASNPQGEHILNSLMILADKPETNVPDPLSPSVAVFGEDDNLEDANVIYFRKGDYRLIDYYHSVFGQEGQMPYTKNGQIIYLEPGAFVRGAFHGHGYDQIKLRGRGIITGQNYSFHWFRDENDKKDPFINFIGCEDVEIEGVIVENPTHHTIPSSKRTSIKNLKIIGWSYNQDGIRPGGDSVADQIFIKTNDDYDYARDPHVVKNSVFWPTHNGAVGMLGWNDLGSGYAEYINNAYINSETRNVNNNTGIIGSQAKDGMKLRENYLSDLYIEDEHAYLVNATYTLKDELNPGYLNDFTFRNITTEYPFQFTNGVTALQRMNGLTDNWLSGWTFTNLIVDGVLVTFDNHSDYFNINLEGTNGINEDADNFVQNVTFDTEGDLFQLSSSVGVGGQIHPSGLDGEITCIGERDQSVTVVPDEGFRIKRIVVDGVEQFLYGTSSSSDRSQVIYFQDVTDNHSFAVEFEEGDDYFGPSGGVSDLKGVSEQGVIHLSWFDNSNQESEIKVWRKEDAGEYIEIASLAPDAMSYMDIETDAGKSYTYYVESFDVDASLGSTEPLTIESVVLRTDWDNELSVVVYPNPVQSGSQLHLIVEGSNQLNTYELIDIDGRILSKGVLKGKSTVLDIDLRPGLNILKLYTEDGNIISKKLWVE